MSIIIPEEILSNTLQTLLKYLYNDLDTKMNKYNSDDPHDKDSGVTFSKVRDGNASQTELQQATFVADTNGSLAGKAFYYYTPSQKYFFWFNTGSTAAPSLSGVGVEISISQNDSANDVATAALAAFQSVGFVADTIGTGQLEITTPIGNAETLSKVYQIWKDIKFGKIDFYSTIKAILIDKFTTEKRQLNISLGYNQNNQKFPSISILLPNEEYVPSQASFGEGEILNSQSGKYSYSQGQHFECIYNLLITSDNENEVIVLYHFLKTLILSAMDQFTLRGLQNIKITGRDIMMDFEIGVPLFNRTVALGFSYNNIVEDLIDNDQAESYTFTQDNIS